MARRDCFAFTIFLVLSLLGTGMATGWGDLVASDDLTLDNRSDDVPTAPDLVSPALGLPFTFLFVAPLLVAWDRLAVEQLLTSLSFLAPVQIPRAPPI